MINLMRTAVASKPRTDFHKNTGASHTLEQAAKAVRSVSLVLIPHILILEVDVERELPNLLYRTRVDEILEALPFLHCAHFKPKHIQLGVRQR